MFLLFWIPSIPFYYIWNFIPTLLGITLWALMGLSLILCGGVFILAGGIWLTITIFYFVSLPDIVILLLLLCVLSMIIFFYAGFTGNSFNFIELGRKSWLLTDEMRIEMTMNSL